ncbi:virion structural protein [Pseudomonas phage PA1C]|uniref:Virion structural protein n=2 Tax=root TaxID=1 RepID=A0A5C1K6Z7_9CAUD|nr:internal head protein [Pseudomonas phage vB_PaeM_PS119XW]QBX32344.1 virion structural protein [Pseudomonas phage PA1C]QEM41918.1 hypothetical protein [Pseudomonas phage vB_PaeM_PS119XW]BEG72434.1 hypothetical protein RVBP21_0620 [Pseudomonas phage BRkr]
MARANLFDLCRSISNESITEEVENKAAGTVTEASDQNVDLEGKKDLEPQLKSDEGEKPDADDVDASVTNTQTSEPGPTEGGGDGTAETVDVTNVHTSDTVENHVTAVDQTGLGDVGSAHDEVSADDDNVATTTSVEEHTDGLDTIESGETESVGEADDMVQDIDEAVEALTADGLTSATDAKGAVVNEIASDMGDIENAKASVERYLGILRGMRENGYEVTNELAESMRVGLEMIDPDFFSDTVVSVEELDDSDKHTSARDATESKLTAKMKSLLEAARNVLMRIFNALMDFWRSFTQDATKLKERLRTLRSKVGTLDGGKQIKIGGLQRLSIGKEFVGDSPEAIKRVENTADIVLINWPSKLAEILKKFDDKSTYYFGVQSGLAPEMLDAIDDILSNSFRGFKNVNSNEKDKVPSGMLNSTSVHMSEVLPGNRAMFVGVNTDYAADKTFNFNNAININFSVIPGGDSYGGADTIKTMSAGEAVSVIRATEQLINKVEAAVEGRSKLNELAQRVNQKGSSFLFGALMTGDENSAISSLLAITLARQTANANHLFTGYCLNLVKAEIAVIEAMLKAEHGDVIEGEKA